MKTVNSKWKEAPNPCSSRNKGTIKENHGSSRPRNVKVKTQRMRCLHQSGDRLLNQKGGSTGLNAEEKALEASLASWVGIVLGTG